MTLDQEETEEAIGNCLKDKAHKGDLLSRPHEFDIRLEGASASLLGGRFHCHPRSAKQQQMVDTNL